MATNKESKVEAKADVGKQSEEKPKKATAPKKSTPKTTAPAKGKDSMDIGIDVKAPTKTCTDQFCPFHGTLPVRGQILEGDVVSDKMQMTVVVKKEYMRKNRKYERLEKRSNKYLVHSPPCFEVEMGDHVKIMECRPLSKQVSFVIIENTNRE
jgi:small subunit ribosomal protein S17